MRTGRRFPTGWTAPLLWPRPPIEPVSKVSHSASVYTVSRRCGEETGRCRFEIWTGSRCGCCRRLLDELLPLDHPARFVAVFVDALEKEGWAELGVEINGDPLGAPAYHPRALLCVWLYGFMTGGRSCRKLEAACRDQIPYLWLTGWQQPDHNTLWRFYKEHRQAMRRLFKRTVRTAVANATGGRSCRKLLAGPLGDIMEDKVNGQQIRCFE